MAKWTEEDKTKALAIAEAASAREAARQTGIPLASIGRWMGETKRNGMEQQNGTERNETSKKVKAIAEEAVADAKEEVKEYVAARAKEAADDMLDLVIKAIEEIGKQIDKGPNFDEPKAGWLRALVGVMGQGVEKHQLLTGKPTSRQAHEGQVNVVNEQKYHIIQEIINTPELSDRIRDNYRSRLGDGINQI
jgi:transposase